jgi:hypothetical protein
MIYPSYPVIDECGVVSPFPSPTVPGYKEEHVEKRKWIGIMINII